MIVGQLLEEEFDRLGIRYIAIMDNIDTAKGLSDIVPMQDLFNEWHAKNTSQKVRNVFKNKGMAGIPLTTNPPFGYMKNPENPKEWQIFPNTHPAIIDRETFELVQELRQHRRRPTKSGIVSMFSGLLYCADCGEKLYYSVTNNYKREQAYFFCSSYRKNSEVCSAHYIREKVVEENVLENMRRVFRYVQAYEKEFAKQQMKCYGEEKQKELSEKRRELTKAEKRIKDIDLLIQKIYEDNATGKLSDERFATMSMAYEEEQKNLKEAIPDMQAYLETETDKSEGLQRFIDKVKQITQPTKLTPELVHEFIEKIVIHERRYLDGKRYQLMDIYYNGVGVIRGGTPCQTEDKQSKDGVTNGCTVQNNQYLIQLQERPWGTFLTEGAPNLSFLFGGDGETRKGRAFPFASQTPGFLSACLGCANRHAWTVRSSLSRTFQKK